MLEDLRRPDRCLLLTSHRIEEVGLLADRVITMESGRAVLECGPDQLAERLGLLVWLHVKVGGDRNNDAVAILRDAGFGARLNSRGVLVEVSAQRKAAALSCLTMAGLGVDDFEVWR
jgi:ABC-type multidrug transport system ATPase subunit